nr:MAG TPA: hypothetical protein [Caudoviricetes sp.]
MISIGLSVHLDPGLIYSPALPFWNPESLVHDVGSLTPVNTVVVSPGFNAQNMYCTPSPSVPSLPQCAQITGPLAGSQSLITPSESYVLYIIHSVR